MKTLNAVVKLLAALAALAGVIYVIAVYGDQIVAWARKLLGCCPWDEGEDIPAEEETPVAETEEAPAEEIPAEAPAMDNVPVANEEDFEG